MTPISLLASGAALLLAIALPAVAQDAPEHVVGKMAQEALAAVRTDRRLAERKVTEHLDFDEATRLAVGRGWSQANPAQKQALVREFRSMLVRTYSSASESLKGDTLKVLPARGRAPDDATIVRTQFMRSGGPPLPIEFHVHRTADGWKIYDIAVEGVSLVLTYRSEFDAMVKQDGVDGLIARLGEKNAPREPERRETARRLNPR